MDGDDTLWDTQSLYEDAKAELVDLLGGFGVKPDEVVETLTTVDLQNMERLGLSRRRFPASLRQTFERLVTISGREIDAVTLRQAERIGTRVFERRASVHSDAADFLARLRNEYRLILFTAGDELVQRRRIHQSGLAAQFDKTVITPLKTRESWASLAKAQTLSEETTWSVGNSVRSDVNPAVTLGLRCVLVERGTWQYEIEEMLPGEVWRVDSLRRAATVIQREDSG